MIWCAWIQSPAVSKQQDARWYGFGWSIPLSFGNVCNLIIDMAISTPSCSYCIWNRYCQNHGSILPNFLLLEWFDTLEFNRVPFSNNKMFDDVGFAYRFRYQLTIFEIRLLIGLSRLLHAHIAYETDGAKIIAAFCRISYCFHDLIRLNSIVCHVQRTRCTMVLFLVIDFDINWLMFKVCILIGLSQLIGTHIAYEIGM